MIVRYTTHFVPVVVALVGALSCEAPCEDTGSCGPYDGGAAGAAVDGGRPGVGGGAGIAGGPTLGGSGAQGGAGGGTTADGGADDGGEGGSASGGEGGGAPAPCDATKSPTVEACIVSDEYAVFVSPAGSDRNPGTKSQPLASLANAVAFAVQKDLIVIACGEYAEPLKITDSVRIYGGFDCAAGWTHGTAGRTLVEPGPGAGPALVIQDVADRVVIEGFEFRAEAAEEPRAGESIIAAVVSKSDAVRLRDVKLFAGDAADGSDAEPPQAFASPAPAGNAASMVSGGATLTCACSAGGNTTGGRGGDGDPDGSGPDARATAGAAGTPNRGAGKGGVVGQSCGSGGTGEAGRDAPTQTAKGKGAATYGTWDGAKWLPASGESGVSGGPGQGGGGGRGGDSTTESPGNGGGGGGCGGCGGEGGGAGKGGGASIALMVVDSALSFEGGEIVTGKAGRGGAGAPGQVGQFGGDPGDGGTGACDGGQGGKGSNGAPGGGGAGGISVGVVFMNVEPSLDGVMIEPGTPGIGGAGGDPSGTADDGIPGVDHAMLEL